MSRIATEFSIVPRVLIVDDDLGFLGVMVFMLSRAGLQVKTATSGRTALECVRDGSFDLVIVDHQMTNMRGIEVVRELARTLCCATLMVTSGLITPALADQYRSLGVRSFLHKPFVLSDVSQIVINALG